MTYTEVIISLIHTINDDTNLSDYNKMSIIVSGIKCMKLKRDNILEGYKQAGE